MRLQVQTHLSYATAQPCDILLQIEAVSDEDQACDSAKLSFDAQSSQIEVAGENGIGLRRWIKAGPSFECQYTATFHISRQDPDWGGLVQTPWSSIPGDVIKYLMPSRYCHSDQFLEFVSNQFAGQTGGKLIEAMARWIKQNFTYDGRESTVATTATDSFNRLHGVCRDYAHVLITFARAAGIPARFVSVYALDVEPQDFHAVVEVYLNGTWHLIDPTGMANARQMVRICVGRDAADAAFMTSYGWINLKEQTVEVRQIAV